MEISSSVLVQGFVTLCCIAVSLQGITTENITKHMNQEIYNNLNVSGSASVLATEGTNNSSSSENAETPTVGCEKSSSPDFFTTPLNPQRNENFNGSASQNIGTENADNLTSTEAVRSTEEQTTTTRLLPSGPETLTSAETTETTTSAFSNRTRAVTSSEEKRMATTNAFSNGHSSAEEMTTTTTNRSSNGPEALMSTEENPTTSTSPPSNGPEMIAAVRKMMEQRGLMPLAVLGIILNGMSLWVWGADSTYNTTTFLFKYLAVWDSLCLITFILFVSRIHHLLGQVALPISNVSQRVSVHTTLLVSVTRWLAVSRPLHVRSLLSKTRVRLGCVALLTWSTLIEGLYFYSTYGYLDRQTSWTMYYLHRVLGLALPLVLMVIFNVLLIIKSCRPREDVGLSDQQLMLEARYRLTVAAVCISLCSLTAYPISIITETVTNVHCYQGNVYVCDRFFVYSIKYATFVLQITNLGINFVFYVAFAGRFRHLLAVRMRPCCCFCRDRSSGAESLGTSVGVVTISQSSCGKF